MSKDIARWWFDKLGMKDWAGWVSIPGHLMLGCPNKNFPHDLKDESKEHEAEDGKCEVWANHKMAFITLRDIDDEPTLVHEILHVWVWQFMEDENLPKAQVKDLEQALNALSEALVELRRASGQGPGSPQRTSQGRDG